MVNEARYFQFDSAYRDALRAPFDRAQVGRLPKAGMQLDFVSHANVTDRLNHEAPDWTYTIDHIETAEGHIVGLMGTMTIGGKSIQEAGGISARSSWGEELKLGISDFISRGAMRFGVALDLWIKGDAAKYEDVEGAERTATTPQATDEPRAPAASTPSSDGTEAPPLSEPHGADVQASTVLFDEVPHRFVGIDLDGLCSKCGAASEAEWHRTAKP